MLREINKYIRQVSLGLERWAKRNFFRVAVFNILLIIMFFLYSAGYFHPFFPITINMIVVLSLILSIFLLGTRSSVFFIIAFGFWFFAGLLRIVRIEVWAERTAVYAYQTLLFGVVMLFIENLSIIKKMRKNAR